MMIEEAEALVSYLQATCVERCEYETPAGCVILEFGMSTAIEARRSGPAESCVTRITSPGAGHFVLSHPLQEVLLATPGQHVSKDQVVGFVMVGDRCEAVLAPAEGTFDKYCVEEGVLVGYGASLAELSPLQ
jgi:biotin carboxyl carrier protein